MGNNVDNRFNFGKFFQNWAVMCNNFNQILPFIGITLLQVGPPSWMSGNFATSIWPNSTNMEPYGDYFKPSTTSAKDKFNKLEKILKDYASTLEGTEKTLFEEKFKEFDELTSSEKTQEKYEELLELYDDYKAKIKESKLKEAGVSSSDLENLADLSYENLDNKLKDNDVVDVITAWNSNENTKEINLVKTLQEKYLSASTDEKKKVIAQIKTLHENLADKADELKDDKKLSSSSKKALKSAIETFDAFDKSRLTSEDYVKAFNNLYMATRLAEAEIAEKELQEEFKFLGEESPFDEVELVDDTQRDFRRKGYRVSQNITTPDDDEENIDDALTPPEDPNGAPPADPNGNPPADQNGDPLTAPPVEQTASTPASLAKDQYSYGLGKGEQLYTQLKGLSSGTKTRQILNDINEDNIIGVIDGFNAKVENGKAKYKDDGIIEWLTDDGIKIEDTCEVVKKLMQKAIKANATDNNAYKELVKFYGATTDATGNLQFKQNHKTEWSYGTNGVTDATVKSTYTRQEAEQIDEWINALVEEIKNADSTKSAE